MHKYLFLAYFTVNEQRILSSNSRYITRSVKLGRYVAMCAGCTLSGTYVIP